MRGEACSFKFDVRIKLPGYPDEWQYCTINGSSYQKDGEGKATKFIGTRKTIRNSKKKQLQETILNSIPVSIHIKDVDDNFRYVFCNDESKRLFGTSEDTTTYDVMDPDKVARIEKTDKGGLRHRQALFRIGAYRTERRTRLRHARPQKRRLRRRQAPAAERPLGSKPAERHRTPRQSAQHHDGGDECVHLVLRTGEGQDQFRRRFRQVRTRYFTLRFTRRNSYVSFIRRTKTLYGVHPEADP